MTAAAVTVIVPTRNRPEHLRQALDSVVRVLPDDGEVIVVDQSDDERTQEVVHAANDSRVRRLDSATRGASAARNEGVRASGAQLVLFTDDDCVVGPDWVYFWRSYLDVEDSIGIAFGRVAAPQHDEARGWVPAFDPGRSTHCHGLDVFHQGPAAVGMGANMALRRSAWRAAGGFDERLGAGVALAGAEETDLAYRVVKRGFHIGHVAGVEVVHHLGYRPWSLASAQVQGYAAGLAAMYVKHMRCGDALAARLLLLEGWRRTADATANVVRGRRPAGVRQLHAYQRAAVAAWSLPLDRRHVVFLAPP
jgi:GT2 family glycosyltransferase